MNTTGLWAQLVSSASAPGTDSVQLLDSAVHLGLETAPNVVGCSITEIGTDGYRTSANSGELPLTLDEVQYAADEGPCVAAARTARPHHLVDLSAESDFRVFSAAAVDRGVLSSLSVPMSGAHRPAALNLYASEPGSFADDRAQAVAALLARCVSRLLAAGRPEHLDPGLRPAHERARQVLRAEELLMADTELSRPAAFVRLTELSRTQNRSVHDIVNDLLSRGS